MKAREISNILHSIPHPMKLKDITFWYGYKLGSKQLGTVVSLRLADGSELFLGVRWARIKPPAEQAT